MALLADLVLALHVLFVAFVVVSLVLILIGGVRGWSWVRNRRFRWLHLAAIGVVVAQAWLGVVCPLTNIEMRLREVSGGTSYKGGFIAYWLGRLLYFDAPDWVFTAAYTAFGVAVASAWLLVPPRRSGSRSAG
ncbi:MAG: DUF2784 domain-containing protein [Thermoanaerobaculia bacterium]